MSVVRLLVLGAIRRRHVAHGYSVYRDLGSWRVETWTAVQPGSIYHAVSQLESQGFIASAKSTAGKKRGPVRTEYALTQRGQSELVALIESALKSIDLEQLSAAIAFMELLPRVRVIELLQEGANARRKVPAFLRTLPVEDIPTEPSRHPELIRLWSDYFMNAAHSTDALIATLKSGKYVFQNDKEVK